MLNLEMSDAEILEYESFYMDSYEDFPNGIYITCGDGTVLDASGWDPGGDVTEGSWYQEGIAHPSFMFGEAYIDGYTGEYVVTASRFLEDLNGREAVAADVDLSILLVIQINRITKPIQKLTDTIVAVTDGDFTADIEVHGNDEVTVMAGSMKQFLSVMRNTIGSIVQISDKIDNQARGSNQISGELHEAASGQAEALKLPGQERQARDLPL